MEDERYLKLLYRGITGRQLHLDPPELYTEKIQWFKLHDKNPIYPILCDKLALRNFFRERVGAEYLIALYGDVDYPDQIRITSYNVCYTKLLRNVNVEVVRGCGSCSCGSTAEPLRFLITRLSSKKYIQAQAGSTAVI